MIDLTIGGWHGWHFGPWGRARQWRLHAPDGTVYTAGEIRESRPNALDVDYLRTFPDLRSARAYLRAHSDAQAAVIYLRYRLEDLL